MVRCHVYPPTQSSFFCINWSGSNCGSCTSTKHTCTQHFTACFNYAPCPFFLSLFVSTGKLGTASSSTDFECHWRVWSSKWSFRFLCCARSRSKGPHHYLGLERFKVHRKDQGSNGKGNTQPGLWRFWCLHCWNARCSRWWSSCVGRSTLRCFDFQATKSTNKFFIKFLFGRSCDNSQLGLPWSISWRSLKDV